ncbi:MAG: hypothetical protein ACSHXL_01750 [Bacteroidota bacterium]
MKILIAFTLFFSSFTCFSQTVLGSIPEKLKEISGLVFINDSVLVGHNDGGNSAKIYFLNLEGQILKEVKVDNAKNVDWEDITYDGNDNLYIADIGNNTNKRKDLCIYKVSLKEALTHEKVDAKVINFSYPNQTSFPPADEDLHFDAEALCYYKDSLYIFTKCRTEPWDGNSYVYSLATDQANQKANFLNTFYVGKSGWWQDAITGADIQGNYCYLTTYNRLMVYRIEDGKLFFDHRIYMKPITQKEAIAVNKNGKMVVADERQTALGGGYLYEIPKAAKQPTTQKFKKKK